MISNQSSPTSLAEDRINKPWRAIPSGRITPGEARNLLLALTPPVWVLTSYLGAGTETALAIGLSWMYNDLGGSDIHYTARNGINALAVVVASVGTTKVALGGSYAHGEFTRKGYHWLVLKALLVFTTLQIQDLRDQRGDRKRGRSTIPLILGDSVARWTVALPVIMWSFLCPWFFHTPFLGYLFPGLFGGVVSARVLLWRHIEADKLSWKLWGAWTFTIFCLPLWTVS